MQTRDAHLDFLRGCAIVLVVVGHYLQGSPDFDANLAFRVIYAFHMPLFMVICGIAAARSLAPKFKPSSALACSSFAAAKLVPGKAMRLLLPFFAWAIAAYFLQSHPRQPFAGYLFEIVARPDMGLWFLPVLFCLYVAVAITQFLYRTGLALTAGRFAVLVLVLSFLVTWLSLMAIRPSYMLTLASLYFPFFCAGLLCAGASGRKLSPGEWRALALVATVAFATLLPFWHRTSVDPRLIDWFGQRHSAIIRALIALMTSACGAMAFLAIAREAKAFGAWRLYAVFCYLGMNTLSIYAIHLFFLGFISSFLAIPFAIAASLSVAWILRCSWLTRLLLLGEPRQAEPASFRLPWLAKGLR